MKKKISKFLSGILAFSLLLFSVPTVVNGVEYEVDGLVYRISSGGLIITDCTDTSAEEISIPERATLNTGMKFKVVGIDDYAFGYCNNLSVIHVPDTLKNSNMGNVAFLTSKSIVDFTNGELKNDATMENVIKYIAKQIYDTDEFTDEEMDAITAKFMDRISHIDTSSATTLEDKVMILIKNIDKMGLANETIAKFNTWISLVKYSDMTIKGEADTEIQQYVNGRAFLGLKYEITSTYPLAQENCNLYYVKLDKDNDGTYDSISITGYSGNIQKVTVPEKIDNLPVVDIADEAFANAAMLNTIYLPKTISSMGNKSVGYFADGTLVPGFVIYGYPDTFSQRYALKNSITFRDMTSVPVLSQTELTIDQGALIGITVNNYSGEITWVSSDTSIATVDNGYIKGISRGEVTIYAILSDKTTLECYVTVKGTPVFSTVSVTEPVTTTLEPAISLTSKYTTQTVTTTAEPAISLTSKYPTQTVTTTAEPAISLTSKYPTQTVTTTAEPAISLTSKYPTQTVTTTAEPAISLTSKYTTQTVTTTVKPDISITSIQTTDSSVTTHPTVTNVTLTSSETSTTPKNTTATATVMSTIPSITSTTQKNTTTTITTTEIITSVITSTSVTQSLNTTTSSTTLISSVISSSTTITIITTSATTSDIVTTISASSTITQIPSQTTTSDSLNTSETTAATTETTAIITTETTITTTTLTAISTSVSTVTTVSTTDKPEETKIVLLGDANDDGKVNVRDAAYIAKVLSIGQSYVLPFYADFNQDENINVRDAAAIARALSRKDSYHWIQIIIKVRPI